ncbi:uncharacterized protein BJX67DRAFT_332538 [Aspergillus lucknowensis]|uniref:Uncharacterized protein n=1 Tax=Aspergillus lucknowensis TaxID=176173 RepID=A0ABR4LZA6_9EURO
MAEVTFAGTPLINIWTSVVMGATVVVCVVSVYWARKTTPRQQDEGCKCRLPGVISRLRLTSAGLIHTQLRCTEIFLLPRSPSSISTFAEAGMQVNKLNARVAGELLTNSPGALL